MLLEAGAVDATGVLTLAALPASVTVAPAGELLSSIAWTVSPLLSVQTDKITPGNSTRGYGIISTPPSAPVTTTPSASGSGILVSPLANAVAVNVALPLESFFTSTTLSLKQSIIQLLSSIAGFQGTVFGVVRRRGRACPSSRAPRTYSILTHVPAPPPPPTTTVWRRFRLPHRARARRRR